MPSVFSYIFGLIFYAFHFPENMWPGRFDYWFASHQVRNPRSEGCGGR